MSFLQVNTGALTARAVCVILGAHLLATALAATGAHFPVRGSLVPVNGHKMHLYCTGAGSPVVILEGPQAGIFKIWAPVQQVVSRFTRVCSYDRAGFGWSEPGPLPRTSEQLAGELHEAMRIADVKPPCILVGWSAGGFPVRVFAGKFPGDVAAVVLVDSSHPDVTARLHVNDNPAADIQKWEPFLPILHRLGITRMRLRSSEPRPASFSAEDWDEYISLRNTLNSFKAMAREGEAWRQSFPQVRASNFGDKPLIVLTGARDADPRWRAQWVNGMQAELSRLSTHGKQIIPEKSGHAIPFDAPGAVADAIRAVYTMAIN
jgi:pimeloyl-ACP methyl ester carboxylesterase